MDPFFVFVSFFPSDWVPSPDPGTVTWLSCLAYIFVNRQGFGRGGFVPSLVGLAILGKSLVKGRDPSQSLTAYPSVVGKN